MSALQNLAQTIIDFINNVLVPLIFALAFILFLYGVFKYFFLGATDPKKQTEGRKFVMWGIIAFAVMISVWGLVRLVAGTFGFGGETRPCLPTFTGTTNCTNSGGATGQPENLLPTDPSSEPRDPESNLPGIY